MTCRTCDFLTNKEGLVFETKFWKVALADDQAYLGKCVIDLKQHRPNLSDLNKEEIIDFLEVVKKIENSIKKAFNATMFNWSCSMNNAFKANVESHVHWHVRPRYSHEVKFSGITFQDPEFGHHYSRDRKQKVSEKVGNEIIKEIKKYL